jgi:hypothetical protein
MRTNTFKQTYKQDHLSPVYGHREIYSIGLRRLAQLYWSKVGNTDNEADRQDCLQDMRQ